MAAWLATRGHDVRVVTAPPYYPEWRVRADYRWQPYRVERWAGVGIWRAPVWVPRKPGGFRRLLHLLSFAVSSWPTVLSQLAWRPDVVLTVAPALTCATGGWLIARLSGARSWLHIQYFEVDAAFQLGLLKGSALRKTVLALERLLFRRFDTVSSISGRMMERLQSKGVEPARISYFPNWVDTDSIQPLLRPSMYREQLGISPETAVVLFSGTLGAKQGLMVIPEVARLLLKRRDVLLVVCGEGPLRPQLSAAVEGMPNVRLLPLQPSERLGELLGLADIHLLTQSPEAEDLVLPSKLSGMLASGRPVIATCRPGSELAAIVSECGEVVAPENASCVAAAVEFLADDPDRRTDLGRRARAVAEQSLGRDAVLGRIVERMQSYEDSKPDEASIPIG
jgi:colanic acid biosynthesis glycosyl transferase WcaI